MIVTKTATKPAPLTVDAPTADAPLRSVAEMKAALATRTSGQRQDDLRLWRESVRKVVNDEPSGVADAEMLEDLMERRKWSWDDFQNDCDALRRCDVNKGLLDETAADAKSAELAATANRLGVELKAAEARLKELYQACHEAESQSVNHTLARGQLKQVVNLNKRMFGDGQEAFIDQNFGPDTRREQPFTAGGHVGGRGEKAGFHQ